MISIIKTNLETGLMTESLGGQFLQNNNYFNANSSGNGIIFIMRGFSFAVIWSEKGVICLILIAKISMGFRHQ